MMEVIFARAEHTPFCADLPRLTCRAPALCNPPQPMRMQRPMDVEYDNAQAAAPDNQLSSAQRQ